MFVFTETILTGTVRQGSKDYPKSLTYAKLEVQKSIFLEKGVVSAVGYRDKPTQKRPVCLLSTGCKPNVHVTERRNKTTRKPAHVVLYNRGMGGVDLMDRKVYQIAAERPVYRYWVKVARNIIDISLRNAYELYKHSVTGRVLSCSDFIAEVVEDLCGNDEPFPAAGPPDKSHELKLLDGRAERDCAVCSNRAAGIRRRSRTWCAACQVGCHLQCYERFVHKQ